MSDLASALHRWRQTEVRLRAMEDPASLFPVGSWEWEQLWEAREEAMEAFRVAVQAAAEAPGSPQE